MTDHGRPVHPVNIGEGTPWWTDAPRCVCEDSCHGEACDVCLEEPGDCGMPMDLNVEGDPTRNGAFG